MTELERRKPFSSLEKDVFLNIIQKYDEVLSCKKTNATSALKKKQCWELVKNEFNTSAIVTQKTSTKQLIKLWYNMKAKAREAKTKENVRFLTGGGSSVPDMDPMDAKVMDIDKNILTNIEVDIDSDVNGSTDILGDTNDNAWCNTIEDEVMVVPLPSMNALSQPATSSNVEIKPPETEAVRDYKGLSKTPIKRSFGEKYMNKIDIMKIKILEEELSYKTRIHEEEIKMKIMEREYKQKILEIELEICMNKLKKKE